MDSCFFLFFILSFTSTFLSARGFEPICQATKCSQNGPDILFPFRVPGRQPEHCGMSGFELICNTNTTTIHFPGYGNLGVKSISYKNQNLHLLDPKNCVHEVFLDLNLSSTPFQYYYLLKNYTYLNCSTKISPSFKEIPCLSGLNHHVYTVESSFATPVSCRPIKTVSIPIPYSPSVSDNSLGLRLTWSLPGCENYEARGDYSGFWSKAEASGLFETCQVSQYEITEVAIFNREIKCRSFSPKDQDFFLGGTIIPKSTSQ